MPAFDASVLREGPRDRGRRRGRGGHRGLDDHDPGRGRRADRASAGRSAAHRPLAGRGGPLRPADRGRGRASDRAAARSRSTARPPRTRDSGSATRSRITGAAGASDYTIVGIIEFGSGGSSARGQPRAVHAAGGAAADGQAGPVRRDRRRRERGHDAGAACARGEAGGGSEVRRPDGRRDGRGGRRRHPGGVRLPVHRPARLRRHRRVRRRLPHLQHVLDHRRPADARVRDAAHARRVGASGPERRPPRGRADRAPGLRAGDRRRLRVRRADQGALRGLRLRPPRHQPATDTAGGRHPGSGRDRRDAGLGADAGAASDAGRPARGAARERRLPGGGGASQQETGDHRRRPGRAGGGPDRAGAVRDQRDRAGPRPAGRRPRADVHRRGDAGRPVHPAPRERSRLADREAAWSHRDDSPARTRSANRSGRRRRPRR